MLSDVKYPVSFHNIPSFIIMYYYETFSSFSQKLSSSKYISVTFFTNYNRHNYRSTEI